ncbi:helix-turn-helix domain-containing protein [Paenibacillus methanolicus]|uniref:AraC family transcriptional regulator of arabinose operon n=1 Tax=Paenibacillus methanolicus TaxID=582686 RepID=A0A5S5CB04_9BACL|nr:AraC family transcriptional regulator [Paenibacillus methanolicus]TYP76534.1 AraC family transcriptional regulator of arabinose operon [Paenibacillus methanolicus]
MLTLLSCGYHSIHHDGILRNRPSGSGSYTFVLFKSRAEVTLGGSAFSVPSHTFILFRPTTPHAYRELESPFINDWFHCAGDELPAFLQELNFPADTPIVASDPMLLSRGIMDLQHTFRLGGPLRDRILDCDLRSFFMKLSDLRERTAPDKLGRYYVPFSELRDQLYRSPQLHISVTALAKRFHMSKSYFQHIYKDLFQCSVVTDMINARLEHAKYLLDHTELPVTRIASLCGYENDTHFMRQFKKFVGLTPRQYRYGSEG